MGIFKIILSISLILGAFFISYLILDASLIDDKYVHILKDSMQEDIISLENIFLGFNAQISSIDKEIISYDGKKVLYYSREYQDYECSGTGEDRSCSWTTKRTEESKSDFNVSINNYQFEIPARKYNADFVISKKEIIDLGVNKRLIEKTIPAQSEVYIWALKEDSILKPYYHEQINKNSFLITDSAKYTLESKVENSLLLQALIGGIMIIVLLVIYFINKDYKHKFFLASNGEWFGGKALLDDLTKKDDQKSNLENNNFKK